MNQKKENPKQQPTNQMQKQTKNPTNQITLLWLG